MTPLPPCPHRSLTTTPHNGRERFTCTHPMVCRPNPSELVVAEQCSECPYVGFDAAIARYEPANREQPTPAEHAVRVAFCTPCGNREDNYCRPGGGSCSLAQKLTKPDFVCPAGHFGAIAR